MKYVALLRGINVGGSSSVSMTKLKETLIRAGYSSVITYINSGNVIFYAEETDKEKLTKKIEDILKKAFFPIKTVVISHQELKHIINNTPNNWKTDDLRKYIAFMRNPAIPEDLIKETHPKEGIDFVDKGPGVVYLSTKTSGLTKSSFPKLITKKIYQDITMRNYNTIQKLIDLMEK